MTGAPAATQLALFSFLLMATIAAVCAVVIRGIVVLLARGQRRVVKRAPPAVLVMPARDDRAEIAAVIGAAVHAALSGRHRIIHLSEVPPGGTGWTRQVRARHHASHSPRQ